MKTLALRTITGILFVAVIIGGIMWTPLSFALLFAIISGLTTYEFCSLVNRHLGCQVNNVIATTASVYLFFAFFFINYTNEGLIVFVPYLVPLAYLMIRELYVKNGNTLLNWAFTLMSQLYVALPFALLNILSFINVSADMGVSSIYYNPIITLALFIFIWIGDTAAYIFGSWLGKHRLFPRISPKKSWEGTISAFIIAALASQLVAALFPYFSFTPLANHLAWAGLALVVVGFGTWGDLVESLFKRKLGIKDSGTILPGHGGLLDRFDSSLIAIPVALIYIYTLTQFTL